MTLPDRGVTTLGPATDPCEATWTNEGGGGVKGIRTLTEQHSTTIVFDSFSDEQDVLRRDQQRNNISKINNPQRRFTTDFSVRVSGVVTAILSPNSVADYRVVDTKRAAMVSSRQAEPAQSFSSVIAGGGGGGGLHLHIPPPPSVMISSQSTTSAHSPMSAASPSDSELIASLVEAVPQSASPLYPPPPPAATTRTSFLTELSMVANRLYPTSTASPSPLSSERTNLLRKRCQGTMLQQRGAQQHAASIIVQRQQQQQQEQTAAPMVNSDHHHHRDCEPETPDAVIVVTPSFCTPTAADSTAALPSYASASASSSSAFQSFFAPVPRPADVHRTLLQTAQAASARKRERDADAQHGGEAAGAAKYCRGSGGMDPDGDALHRSGSIGSAAGGGRGERCTGEQGAFSRGVAAFCSDSASFTASSFSAAAPVHVVNSSFNPTGRALPARVRRGEEEGSGPFGATASFSSFTAASHAAAITTAEVPSFRSHFLPPIATTLLSSSSSMLAPADDFFSAMDITTHNTLSRHHQRVSSSDLTFTSLACPVPVAGLLNLSDIQFRHSSEEIIALSVLQELGGGGGSAVKN